MESWIKISINIIVNSLDQIEHKLKKHKIYYTVWYDKSLKDKEIRINKEDEKLNKVFKLFKLNYQDVDEMVFITL